MVRLMSIALMIVIFVGLGVIGVVSTHYLGNDNVVEEEVETLMEDEVEHALHLPEGSMHGKIDLDQHKSENANSAK